MRGTGQWCEDKSQDDRNYYCPSTTVAHLLRAFIFTIAVVLFSEKSEYYTHNTRWCAAKQGGDDSPSHVGGRALRYLLLLMLHSMLQSGRSGLQLT